MACQYIRFSFSGWFVELVTFTRDSLSASALHFNSSALSGADTNALEDPHRREENTHSIGTDWKLDSRTSGGSFSHNASGCIRHLEFRAKRIRHRLAQLLAILGVEESSAANLRPPIEARLEVGIVDREANDVHADVHSLLLEICNRCSRIAAAGLLAIGEEHDNFLAFHAFKVLGDSAQRSTYRRLRHVRRVQLAHHRAHALAVERLQLEQKIALAIRESGAECAESKRRPGRESLLDQIGESTPRDVHASSISEHLEHA